MPNRIGRALLAVGLCAMLAGCQNDQAASPVERPDASIPVSSAAPTVASFIAGEDSASMAATAAVPDTAQDGPAVLKFTDMYASQSSSRGLRFSDAFAAMDGKIVQISGYMAPPLKPVFTFFVLAREPMAICPFCSSDAEWPADIVLIYLSEDTKSIAGDTMLAVTGRLELGSYTDPDTGFVSQARIYADKIEARR